MSFDEYKPLGFSEDFFPEENKHYTTLYFFVQVEKNINIINMEPDKCEAWEWHHISFLPEVFCDTKNQARKLL